MHGVEILQPCGTGFCGVCLCDVVEGGDAVELNKTGEHVFEVAMDEGNHPKQLLACVSGVKSEYFSDEKDHTIVIKKLYEVSLLLLQKEMITAHSKHILRGYLVIYLLVLIW